MKEIFLFRTFYNLKSKILGLHESRFANKTNASSKFEHCRDLSLMNYKTMMEEKIPPALPMKL